MRLLIVFTSPRHSEYSNIWKKSINNLHNNCADINGGKDRLFVFDGRQDDYSGLSRINSIAKQIKEILNKNRDCSYVVLLHTQNLEEIDMVVRNCVAGGTTTHREKFFKYSSTDPIWECIKNFLKEDIGTCFDRLWDTVSEPNIHKLHADLLNPFIPFHLLSQLDPLPNEEEWQKIFNKCRDGIEYIQKNDVLNRFLEGNKDAPSHIRNSVSISFEKLRSYFCSGMRDFSTLREYGDEIDQFAQCLEWYITYQVNSKDYITNFIHDLKLCEFEGLLNDMESTDCNQLIIKESYSTLDNFGSDYISKRANRYEQIRQEVQSDYPGSVQLYEIPNLIKSAGNHYQTILNEINNQNAHDNSVHLILDNGKNIIKLFKQIEDILRQLNSYHEAPYAY